MAHLLQRLILLAGLAAAAQPFSHKEGAQGVACTECHPREAGTAVKSKQKIARFNHQLHMKFGNIAPMIKAAIAGKEYLDTKIPRHLDTKNSCAGCHHGIEQSVDVSKANVFPHMGDCLICHNKIEAPFSCEKCHDNVPALKPANHSRDFIDRHNRNNEGLDRSSCFTCHGKRFTCLGCH